jgi:hypothetical protein
MQIIRESTTRKRLIELPPSRITLFIFPPIASVRDVARLNFVWVEASWGTLSRCSAGDAHTFGKLMYRETQFTWRRGFYG